MKDWVQVLWLNGLTNGGGGGGGGGVGEKTRIYLIIGSIKKQLINLCIVHIQTWRLESFCW